MKKIRKLLQILILLFIVCTARAQLFTINIIPSQGFCVNSAVPSATMSAINPSIGIVSYSWSVGHIVCSATVVPSSPNASTVTVYFQPTFDCCGSWFVTCWGYDINNNVVAYFTKTYTIHCSPNMNVATTYTNTTLCRGETATLTASGAQSYSWSGPAVSNFTTVSVSVSPSVTGCYSVTGSNTLGCTSNAVKCFTVSSCLNTSKFITVAPLNPVK